MSKIDIIRKISEQTNWSNKFTMKSRCYSDRAIAFTMAAHNIGAGGVSVFCSTNETPVSIKRHKQRNTRCMRANGIQN